MILDSPCIVKKPKCTQTILRAFKKSNAMEPDRLDNFLLSHSGVISKKSKNVLTQFTFVIKGQR